MGLGEEGWLEWQCPCMGDDARLLKELMGFRRAKEWVLGVLRKYWLSLEEQNKQDWGGLWCLRQRVQFWSFDRGGEMGKGKRKEWHETRSLAHWLAGKVLIERQGLGNVPLKNQLVEGIKVHLNAKSICTQYVGKFGKLSSAHRTGKGQFSFQSQRRTMAKNVQTTTQLYSSHTLAK